MLAFQAILEDFCIEAELILCVGNLIYLKGLAEHRRAFRNDYRTVVTRWRCVPELPSLRLLLVPIRG